MRLVTIDNGNTHPHAGLFESGVLKGVVPIDKYVPESDDYILIASVGQTLKIKPSFDLKSKRTMSHFFDMRVHYSQTLGEDRLIAGYGVYKKIKSAERVLLIDAGTFITCDLITNDGFQGGYIFPGISRFLKIYSYSAQLPLLSKDQLYSENDDLPRSTEEAIIKATEIYLKSSIEQVITKTSPDKIVFTGGNASSIKNLISLKVRSETDRHLIHSALSLIYEHHLSRE
ncbi:MAG: type III pantothenate kinase [Bacteriovorax sp.]|nr:type III pantothenate kinase [Bacteriovorax sp.]